jgi:hypothetical protein
MGLMLWPSIIRHCIHNKHKITSLSRLFSLILINQCKFLYPFDELSSSSDTYIKVLIMCRCGFKIKLLIVGGKKLKLTIWETGKQCQ